MHQPTPSLDFPERTVLTVQECAGKLRVSDKHIVEMIEDGRLCALNVGTDLRRHYRIPYEAWVGFLRARDSGN
jgi:excisionase family DNA binding protein